MLVLALPLSGTWGVGKVHLLPKAASLICRMLPASEDRDMPPHAALSMLAINVSDCLIHWHPLKELEVICNEKYN